jgi:threonine aldolase
MIDLRSDTVTQPTEAMRQAMASAAVGDDVYGEDPTVRALEEMTADRLGKEAGLFLASGTMGNLVALLAHAGRGDEVILGDLSHTFLYEAGGCAALGGIHPHTLPNETDGTLDLTRIRRAIRDPEDPHAPHTRLVVIENTHNRCGGIALSAEYGERVAALAEAHGLTMHLDGARLFNAAIALDCPTKRLTKPFDSVTICLSKGLGAPVGSVLCGSSEFIRSAHRARKLVGGGMRQAGIIAAGGLYALTHHVERLAEDHEHARQLASGIAETPGLSCPQAADPAKGAWTNLVYFTVDGEAAGCPEVTAPELVQRLQRRGVLAHVLGSEGTKIRMATHLQISSQDIQATLRHLRLCLNGT